MSNQAQALRAVALITMFDTMRLASYEANPQEGSLTLRPVCGEEPFALVCTAERFSTEAQALLPGDELIVTFKGSDQDQSLKFDGQAFRWKGISIFLDDVEAIVKLIRSAPAELETAPAAPAEEKPKDEPQY